jgi:RecA/RadA recombinase
MVKNPLPSEKLFKAKEEMIKAKEQLAKLLNHNNKRNGKTFSEWKQVLANMPKAIKRETGIKLLDDIFGGGIDEGNFINLIGESSAGKSTLALEILTNVSQGGKAVFFSFEMGLRKSIGKIEDFNPTDVQCENLIIDFDSFNIETIATEITLYANDGAKFFVVDSKMKIDASGFSHEYQKISYISNVLAKLAQSLEIIIILINQVSEENLKNNRVSLKGSGDQVYDSDIILVYKKIADKPDERELEVFKNRQNDITKKIITTLRNGRTVGVGVATETSYSDTSSNIEMPFL